MKILIATESYYPNISGVAVFSHNLAEKMAKKGHKVFVMAPSPKFKEFKETIDGVVIFRVASKINRFRKGYQVSKFPFVRVFEIMEEVKPDIIHCQDPALISMAALWKARRMKIPKVVTNHFSLEYIISYLPYLKFIHPLLMKIGTNYLNWFYGKFDVLTCPTQIVANRFLENGIKTKIEVISNGVDLSRFMPYYGDSYLVSKKYNIPLGKPVVLYVGRIDIDKNIETYIKSIPFVLKNLDAHFVIVGDGTEKEKLEKMVEKLAIKNNLSFINFIPYQDSLLPKIYPVSSLFVNPCPTETQSIVALEAQATGLPIVAANCGALPELVEDGENGFLFAPKDERDLAAKITKILKTKNLAKKMGEKSLEKVHSHIAERTYNKFEAIYQDLLRKWEEKDSLF